MGEEARGSGKEKGSVEQSVSQSARSVRLCSVRALRRVFKLILKASSLQAFQQSSLHHPRSPAARRKKHRARQGTWCKTRSLAALKRLRRSEAEGKLDHTLFLRPATLPSRLLPGDLPADKGEFLANHTVARPTAISTYFACAFGYFAFILIF